MIKFGTKNAKNMIKFSIEMTKNRVFTEIEAVGRDRGVKFGTKKYEKYDKIGYRNDQNSSFYPTSKILKICFFLSKLQSKFRLFGIFVC